MSSITHLLRQHCAPYDMNWKEQDAAYEKWEGEELINQGGVYPREAWFAGYAACRDEFKTATLMTESDWLALPLRQRDKLIAEKIFGYECLGMSHIYTHPETGEPCYSCVGEFGSYLKPIGKLTGEPEK